MPPGWLIHKVNRLLKTHDHAYTRQAILHCLGTRWLRAAPSSSRVYLMKSFLSTRMRMVAKKPVSSSTVTQELMMENQWICAAHTQ